MDNRKDDIIIELGQQWIRIGLVGDRVPRKTLRSGILGQYKQYESSEKYENSVEQMLNSIFYSHLNTSCLNRSVLIMEHVFTDRRITEALAKVMFTKLKIQKMEFILSCVAPLYLTGRFSGLVVSGGFSAVEIMPVYQSFPLFNLFKNIPTGTNAMIKLLKDELVLNNPTVKPQVFAKLTDQFLGETRNSFSNMGLLQGQINQEKTISFQKNKLKFKPASISYENLFGDPENEEYNIAYSFLQIIENLPYEMVDSVCGNIVFAGGLWKVKGMQNYFKKSVKKYLQKFQKIQKRNIAQKLRFVSWGFNPSEVSWTGCSVGASVKAVESMCLKRVDYEKDGFTEKIMEAYFLSN